MRHNPYIAPQLAEELYEWAISAENPRSNRPAMRIANRGGLTGAAIEQPKANADGYTMCRVSIDPAGCRRLDLRRVPGESRSTVAAVLASLPLTNNPLRSTVKPETRGHLGDAG